MSLKKPRPERGGIIESATDPAAENSAYEVNAATLWLDVGSTPAVLYERNATNTGWNALGGSSSSDISSEVKGYSFGMNILFGS